MDDNVRAFWSGNMAGTGHGWPGQHLRCEMNKTKNWYKNHGLAGRVKREAAIAKKYNPKCKVVICDGCGADTTNPTMLCDNCQRYE